MDVIGAAQQRKCHVSFDQFSMQQVSIVSYNKVNNEMNTKREVLLRNNT